MCIHLCCPLYVIAKLTSSCYEKHKASLLLKLFSFFQAQCQRKVCCWADCPIYLTYFVPLAIQISSVYFGLKEQYLLLQRTSTNRLMSSCQSFFIIDYLQRYYGHLMENYLSRPRMLVEQRGYICMGFPVKFHSNLFVVSLQYHLVWFQQLLYFWI